MSTPTAPTVQDPLWSFQRVGKENRPNPGYGWAASVARAYASQAIQVGLWLYTTPRYSLSLLTFRIEGKTAAAQVQAPYRLPNLAVHPVVQHEERHPEQGERVLRP